MNLNEELLKHSYLGNIEICIFLITKGADLNYISECKFLNNENSIIEKNEKYTPLMLSAYNGHLEVSKLLITKGACVDVINSLNQTALCLASYNGQCKVSKLLIEYGADINKEESAPLIYAINGNQYEVCELLLKEGANLTEKYSDEDYYDISNFENYDIRNKTFLCALRNKNSSICKLLIDYGINIQGSNEYGYGNFDDALENKNYNITKLLIDSGEKYSAVMDDRELYFELKFSRYD